MTAARCRARTDSARPSAIAPCAMCSRMMGAAQRIVPPETAAPPRARSYCSARISRLLAIPASARKWATGAGAQQDSRTDVRAGRCGAAESVPLRAPQTLAKCPRCWHYESMAIQINIRDVPERVRDELAARAALQGKSMQEFLRAELERLAARPSIDAWLQQVRKRKHATQTRVSSKQILENRNADRR
jgi:plasmid stability protein